MTKKLIQPLFELTSMRKKVEEANAIVNSAKKNLAEAEQLVEQFLLYVDINW